MSIDTFIPLKNDIPVQEIRAQERLEAGYELSGGVL